MAEATETMTSAKEKMETGTETGSNDTVIVVEEKKGEDVTNPNDT